MLCGAVFGLKRVKQRKRQAATGGQELADRGSSVPPAGSASAEQIHEIDGSVPAASANAEQVHEVDGSGPATSASAGAGAKQVHEMGGSKVPVTSASAGAKQVHEIDGQARHEL